jgi:hypothetical protein
VPEPPIDAIPQEVIACALDANCMPKGRLVLDHVVQLADVIDEQDLDVEIWIPEPVVWEWAEHLFDDLNRARERYTDTLDDADAAGLEVPDGAAADEMTELHSVVTGIEDALNDVDHVVVLSLSTYPTAAVQGLRDQVLQLGVGRRKTDPDGKGVKTGAADSATFRLIEHRAGLNLVRVVLISADKDARTYFEESPGPQILKSIWSAKRSLLKLLTGSEAAHEAVKQAVAEDLPDLETLAGATLEGGSHAFSEHYFDQSRYLTTEISALGVDSVVAVTDVEVSKSDGYATAQARITVALQLEAVWWDDFDDRLEHEWEPAYEVPATAQVSLTYEDDNWTVTVDHIVVD